MKTFITTAAAVLVGIWLWNRYKFTNSKPASTGGAQSTGAFYGPNIDPTTGDYVPSGNATGTVSYGSVQTGGLKTNPLNRSKL